MKVIILLSLLAIATAIPATLFSHYTEEEAAGLFDKWASRFQKTYTVEEKVERLAKFIHNLEFVHRHNQEHDLGLQTYTVELNEFADMSSSEFAVRHGFKYDANAIRNEVYINETAPASVDWRTKGAVTPVKNQGQCGSCWAFSTTGSLEGANFLKTGKLVSFSEQELVDCDKVDNGCNGGLMDNAFEFVQANGLDTEDDYQYTAMDGQCDSAKEAKGRKIAKCNGHTDVPANSEQQLANAVAKQPVSVAIEADQQGFQLYRSGVFSGQCGTQLDHGVLAVGFGKEGSQEYWIVKNSWGAQWGEQGYIRLIKGIGGAGQCGIAMSASYPQA